MIRTLKVEASKTRRRYIWLPVLAILFVQMAWAVWALSRWKQADFSQGWMYILYQFPLLNCIMMPVVIAMIASRLADAEHKGQSFRLLHTLQRPGRLFDGKLLCGCGYVLIASLLQYAAVIGLGVIYGFGPIPWERLGLFLLGNLCVGMTLYLLQQSISLLLQNQLATLIVGLAGAFIGLTALFFSASMQKLVLWSYYGVLSTSSLDWNPETRVSVFSWQAYDWGNYIPLITAFVLLYLIGKTLYSRKEL